MSDEAPQSTIRPMTEKERELAQALSRCRFLPASWDKRFVREMSTQTQVTEKQAHALVRLAWKYRRQLDPSIRPSTEPAPLGARRPNELARVL